MLIDEVTVGFRLMDIYWTRHTWGVGNGNWEKDGGAAGFSGYWLMIEGLTKLRALLYQSRAGVSTTTCGIISPIWWKNK